MGLNVSPGFLQRVLEEVLATLCAEADISWVHVDDLMIVAPPQRIESLRDRLLQRLALAGFGVNQCKSQLTPVSRIEYLGLDIDLRKRYFQVAAAHLRTFALLFQLPIEKLRPKQQLSVRGFLTFIMAVAIRQYSPVKWPLISLMSFLRALYSITGFQGHTTTATSSPGGLRRCYVSYAGLYGYRFRPQFVYPMRDSRHIMSYWRCC